MLYIIGGILLVAVMYFVLRGAFKADKQIVAYVSSVEQNFTDAEKNVIAKLKEEEQKAMDLFKQGKEDIIAEYERIKDRLENLGSLTNKLPAAKIVQEAQQVAAQVVVEQPVAPVVVETPVAPAPEVKPAGIQ